MADVLNPLALSFQDAAQRQENDTRLRPWEAFWPPKTEEELKLWLTTDTPEVLAWRFDPKNTFNRPWRAYTRTELAKTEKAYDILPVKGADHPVPDESQIPENVIEFAEDDKHTEGMPLVLCEELEEQLRSNPFEVNHIESFNYLAPLEIYKVRKPYLSRLPFVKELKRSNIVGKGYAVDIRNVRGFEHLFELDKSGFEFHGMPFHLDTWTDDSVQTIYIPYLKEWLKTHFSAKRVVIYAYNFRGNDQGASDKKKPWKAPFYLTHCDATEASCKLRMEMHFPQEKDEVLKERYRFVNIWRSFTPPPQDCPLALCDYRTVSTREYLKTDVIFPHCCDEGYDVQYAPAHRWFYQKNMTTDEVILFKLHDNAEGVATCVAHGAFHDTSSKDVRVQRASVEVRAIILGGK